MTLQERKAAAVVALSEAITEAMEAGKALKDGTMLAFRLNADAEKICRAFAPELFTVPPTGWIAPTAVDDEMQKAGWEVQPLGPCCDWDMKTIFEAMGDNYRARHPMKPTEAKE